MYLCIISTHELLLPAAIISFQMKRHMWGINHLGGINIVAAGQTMNDFGLNEIRTRVSPVMNRQDKFI